MKAVFNKFVGQLKAGCSHEICFSQYCKKNTLSSNASFANDQQLMRFALQTLSASKDPEKLLCSRAVPLSRSNLKLLAKNDSQALTDALRDVHALCCSFTRSADEDEEIEVLPQFQAKTNGTTNEPSARSYARLAIDFKAAQLYFNVLKSTRSAVDCGNLVSQAAEEILELYRDFVRAGETGQAKAQAESGVPVMCARGLLILICCDGLAGSSDTRWVATQVLSSFLEVVKGSATERKRLGLTAEQQLDLKRIDQMVANFPKAMLLEYVMQLQATLSNIVVYRSGDIDTELLKSIVRTLDYL